MVLILEMTANYDQLLALGVAFLAALNAPFQPNERLKKAMEDAARLAQR